jgi:hypothetical protein
MAVQATIIRRRGVGDVVQGGSEEILPPGRRG